MKPLKNDVLLKYISKQNMNRYKMLTMLISKWQNNRGYLFFLSVKGLYYFSNKFFFNPTSNMFSINLFYSFSEI